MYYLPLVDGLGSDEAMVSYSRTWMTSSCLEDILDECNWGLHMGSQIHFQCLGLKKYLFLIGWNLHGMNGFSKARENFFGSTCAKYRMTQTETETQKHWIARVLGSPRPPYKVHAPLREILDPPLLYYLLLQIRINCLPNSADYSDGQREKHGTCTYNALKKQIDFTSRHDVPDPADLATVSKCCLIF